MSELVIAREYNLLKDVFLQNFSEKILEVRKSTPNLEPVEGSAEIKKQLRGNLYEISQILSELNNTLFPIKRATLSKFWINSKQNRQLSEHFR